MLLTRSIRNYLLDYVHDRKNINTHRHADKANARQAYIEIKDSLHRVIETEGS